MRTVVLFPTAGEAEAFRRRCPGVAYRITGVGPAAAAAATARAIVDERPDLLLLAGIAGVYPASEVAGGEVVAVAEERVEGLPERYADVYRPTFAVPGLRTAVSNSVARSGAAPAGAEVENMEGAAFFAVAAALGVPAAEVRAVSNRVGEPFGVWRVADACEALARELALLVGEIGSVSSQDRLPLRRSAVEQRITVDDGRQHGIADLRNIGSVGRRDAFVQLLDILESDLEREALRRDTTVEQCLEHERIVGAGRNTEAQPVSHRRRPKAVFS